MGIVDDHNGRARNVMSSTSLEIPVIRSIILLMTLEWKLKVPSCIVEFQIFDSLLPLTGPRKTITKDIQNDTFTQVSKRDFITK